MPDTPAVTRPSDYTALSNEELSALVTNAKSAFALALEANDDAQMLELVEIAEAASTELSTRTAQLSTETVALSVETLSSRMSQVSEITAPVEPAPADPEPVVAAATKSKTPVEHVISDGNKLNARLADAANYVPTGSQPKLTDKFAQSALVASADIPGFATGGKLENMEALIAAMTSRAKALPVTKSRVPTFYPVAALQRQFRTVMDDNTSPADVQELMREVANPAALVASGGWCSPSEIKYDFYEIVGTDGLLDLPTIGIRRGGIRWPISPSFKDLSDVTCLWAWNETQDIAALTGTSQSGTKTCCHVPCASYCEKRLQCEGLCVTAGNLATSAWPESIANYLRLVNAGHVHRINAAVIAQMAAANNDATCTGSITVSVCPTGTGLTVPVLDAIEMQAIDYRTRYAMNSWEVLEVVLPDWILGGIRADLAKRVYGSPDFNFQISNAQIANWFNIRSVRVQFVQDWQVRATGFPGRGTVEMTTWPTTVQFLIYAAGTWVRGNGMSLDLGVVRDSTLNATNDHTAAWMEECFLVARFGHESRLVTVPICPNGTVGAATTYTCPTC